MTNPTNRAGLPAARAPVAAVGVTPERPLQRQPALEPATGRPGRRRLAIDERIVEAMASIGGTDAEIADFLGCDPGTIRNRCADVLAKARASMRTRLRRAQFRAALGGNPALLIWLGKQMLGQSDKIEHEVAAPGGGPVEIIVKHSVVDPRHDGDGDHVAIDFAPRERT
jgi:DNA-binding CsgD family transcriptional regulator